MAVELTWSNLQFELDAFQVWLIEQRSAEDKGVVFAIFDGFRLFADNLVAWLEDALFWLTWVGTTVMGTLVVARFGGRRAAAITLAAFATFALTGLWEESVQTLALMLAAVTLSLLVGIPLGIAVGRSRRVARTVTPVLDAAQIVPAFAYLMPVVILFSVGPAAAVVATMVYAIPPSVRITALGIRGVAVNTVEAAVSLGSTRRQTLTKVQLPLARRMLLLGVNQTILFALSMVVIAGLIGGGGLGAVVNSGLSSTPALALLAGLVIVVMAIALDRSTEAIAERTDPARRHLDAAGRRRARLMSLAVVATSPPSPRRSCSASRPATRTRQGSGARGYRRRNGCSPGSRACWTTCKIRRRGCSRSPSPSGSSSSRSSCCRSSSSWSRRRGSRPSPA